MAGRPGRRVHRQEWRGRRPILNRNIDYPFFKECKILIVYYQAMCEILDEVAKRRIYHNIGCVVHV
jgi:hypothetical protein